MLQLTEAEKNDVVKAVKERFDQLVSALNKIDTAKWESFYSDDFPVTAVAGVDFYGDKKTWVETVGEYFSQRKSQTVEPVAVKITPLAHDLALLVSEENTSMAQDDGSVVKSKHVFTMVWKNGKSGWKVLHSHESWVDS
ncbi:YybH family protein [Solidesulfovibrio alcoholivorans]|uniref:YybH family protein n=1 Tax=Solidesulfovibrio alcoholivorans TaxID=81406 RepID=UPI00138E1BB3|nr:nuclear transport factor 2 family protein [Solidesulfovibrio alcoholivorans]